MILSCTGLGKAAISGLSRSSTALSALHTRLTAFYAECTSFWYVNFASEMKNNPPCTCGYRCGHYSRDRLRFVAIRVGDNHQQVDIADEATRVSFLPFMILSCTGLGKTTTSGLSRSRTVLTALHTSLTAFHAGMCLILVCSFYLRNEGFWSSWRCSGVYGCV